MADQGPIPPMGFGTYDRRGPAGIEAILCALETGYRHLDTAQTYDTEAECGVALGRSGLKRGDVFVTTKITDANCGAGALVPSLRRSLDALQLVEVDLTLIHWPVSPRGPLDLSVCLSQLAEAQALGLTRLIGVSNFTIADLRAAESILGPGRIVTNQFERHPYLQNQRLVDFCVERGIKVTCYLPLARGACAGDPTIEAIASKHGATPHQIALAFSLAQGHVVIPTSGKPERIRENFAAQNLRLLPEDISAIEKLDRGTRQVDPIWSPKWD